MMLKKSLFRVEWSELYRPEGREPYRVNKSAHVACETLEDAIALVRDEAPGEEQIMHKVNRIGTTLPVIVG